ncbi:MAG TPA: hypothetical protein VMU38_09530 [Candidatus Binatia bacterium]|nr:hypothetical protein [Candidatus Binatia bacterium]
MRPLIVLFLIAVAAGCAAPGSTSLSRLDLGALARGAATKESAYWTFFSNQQQPELETAAVPLTKKSKVKNINGNSKNMLRDACCIRFYQNQAYVLGNTSGSSQPNTLWIFELPLTTASKVQYYDTLEGESFAVHMEFDAHGNLWVSSLGYERGTPEVTEYAAGSFFQEGGSISPSLTLTDGLDGPQGLGFDKNGRLYVANANSNEIAVFAQPIQNQQPYYLEGIESPGGIAFDAHGNLFAASNDGSTGAMAEYKSDHLHAGDKPNVIDPQGINASPYGSDLAFDGAGNLYDGDCGDTAGIYEWPLSTAKFSKTLAPSFYTNATILQNGCAWGLAIR